MAGQLMLVNPRRRRRRLRRNPTGGLSSADYSPPAPRRKRAATGKRKRKSAFKAFGASAKRGVGRARKRASKFFSAIRRGARRPKRKTRQSVRALVSNPLGFLRQTVAPAVFGAAGALALDAAYAYLPLPANLKTGAFAPVVKIGAVGLLGAVVSHFAPTKQLKMVHTAVTASIVIIAFGFLKTQLQRALPNVRLGELLDDDCGNAALSYAQAGLFMPDEGMNEYVSEYISDYDDGLGHTSAVDFAHTDGMYADFVS